MVGLLEDGPFLIKDQLWQRHWEGDLQQGRRVLFRSDVFQVVGMVAWGQ